MNRTQKVIKCVDRYEKCVFRYEIGFSLKNSDFSYLCGSISYLFGYEKNRYFFLMGTRMQAGQCVARGRATGRTSAGCVCARGRGHPYASGAVRGARPRHGATVISNPARRHLAAKIWFSNPLAKFDRFKRMSHIYQTVFRCLWCQGL